MLLKVSWYSFLVLLSSLVESGLADVEFQTHHVQDLEKPADGEGIPGGFERLEVFHDLGIDALELSLLFLWPCVEKGIKYAGLISFLGEKLKFSVKKPKN